MRIRSNKIIYWKSFLKSIFLLAFAVSFTDPASAKWPNSEEVRNGRSVYEAEKLLAEKGYWIKKVDSVMDSSTFHALVAFEKVERRKRTGKLAQPVLEAIRKAVRPIPSYSGFAHIEIDLARQVLFLVNDDGLVTHILPVSTGSGKIYYQDGKKLIAYTPRGFFKITRQIKGLRRAPLGNLYHPNYFYEGFAIHGSNSIPVYPASHGCVRIPRFAAQEFSNLVTVGLTVIVFDKAQQTPIGQI